MKLIKTEYTPIKGCIDFWAWFWFTRDYPFYSMYGENRVEWFRHCGSDDRLLIRRRFGFTREHYYNRNEFGLFYLFLGMIACAFGAILLSEIMLIIILFI